jgi:hypothetical protein
VQKSTYLKRWCCCKLPFFVFVLRCLFNSLVLFHVPLVVQVHSHNPSLSYLFKNLYTKAWKISNMYSALVLKICTATKHRSWKSVLPPTTKNLLCIQKSVLPPNFLSILGSLNSRGPPKIIYVLAKPTKDLCLGCQATESQQQQADVGFVGCTIFSAKSLLAPRPNHTATGTKRTCTGTVSASWASAVVASSSKCRAHLKASPQQTQ